MQDMKKTNDNNFILTSQRLQLMINDSSYAKIFVTDSVGIVKREKNISSPDEVVFNSLITLSNGDIIFAGEADFIAPGGRDDIYIIRTDSLLNYPPNIIGINLISTEIPVKFVLHQNFPNPFNPSSKIKFELPSAGLTQIKIFDILGREVQVLVNKYLNAGIYEVEFDASNLASGIYFYSMETNGFKETKKMILTK
jgi:hypothetical protein